MNGLEFDNNSQDVDFDEYSKYKRLLFINTKKKMY